MIKNLIFLSQEIPRGSEIRKKLARIQESKKHWISDPQHRRAGSCNIFPKFSGVGLRYLRYLGLGGHLVLAERNDDLEVVPVVQLDVPATRLHQHLLHLPNYQFSSVLGIRIRIF
jgi:hypothetical protein